MPPLSRRHFLAAAAATLATPSIVRAQAIRSARINVADFGARPDASADSTAALRAAITACAPANSVLHFPQGQYLFRNPSTESSLAFANLAAFEIDGNGSTLLFEGAGTGISFTNINGLELHDLALDWKRPSFSQGTITNLSADGLTATITISPEYPLTGQEIVRGIHFFDPATNLPFTRRRGAELPPGLANIQYTGTQTYQAQFKRPLPDSNFAVVLLHKRAAYGLLAENSQQIKISGLRVYTAPGMAIAGGQLHDVTLDQCQVAPRAGSGRLLSSGADGFHLWDSSGTVSVSNCQFASTGDDCINVHAFFLAATSESASTIEIAASNQIRDKARRVTDTLLPTRGEVLEIVNPTDFAPLGDATVDHVDRAGGQRLLTTTQPLALAPGREILIDDLNRTPAKLLISNCEFRNTPARGILVHANTSITGNSFTDLGSVAIFCGTDQSWLEGPLVSNIVIENNHFTRCGLTSGGSTWVNTSVRNPAGHGEQQGDAVAFNNVQIISNIYTDPVGRPVVVGETSNAVIRDNQFITTDESNRAGKSLPGITLHDVAGAIVEGNVCTGGNRALTIDPSSTQVTVNQNSGFDAGSRSDLE